MNRAFGTEVYKSMERYKYPHKRVGFLEEATDITGGVVYYYPSYYSFVRKSRK